MAKIEKLFIGLKWSASSETYNGTIFRKISKKIRPKIFRGLRKFSTFFSKIRRNSFIFITNILQIIVPVHTWWKKARQSVYFNKNCCALTGWPVVVWYAQLNFHVCHITEIDRFSFGSCNCTVKTEMRKKCGKDAF